MECQLQLVQTAARHVRCFLDETMEFECNGCSVDHPSQLQHECIMLGGEDRIRFCLDQALLLVDWERVKTDFDQSWSHTRFHDKVWYQTLSTNDGWYEHLVSALLALDCLSDAWPDFCGDVYVPALPFPTFILLNALTTDGLYMAYHFPSQQYIGLLECKHCFAIILRGGCSHNCPDSDSVNEDVSFLQYILCTIGEIIIDRKSSSPV